MTATASNRSQKYWGRRLHFPFGGLLRNAETERFDSLGSPVINVARLPIFKFYWK